uniref:Major facilitator superfamily domain-containing protein 12 isoform X2 n=1 Tax=Rhizophora mucronata TaxID=61149 RepID=A0A2P2LCN6_RHIMU
MVLQCRLKISVHGNSCARVPWNYWFRKILYYQVGLVYVLTRLVQNVSQAYLAYYVIDDLRMAQSAKALVPAIIYVSSFIISVIMQEISWTSHHLKAYYSAGGITWAFCGSFILLLPRSMNAFMYFIAVFIGIANALMTVTAVSMQSALVGSDLNGCAFVYGSLSFLDKISCGLAMYALQSFQSTSPDVQDRLSTSHVSITRYGLSLVPGFCSLVGVAVTYSMKLHTPYTKPLREPLLE